jgi:hypothetical protein
MPGIVAHTFNPSARDSQGYTEKSCLEKPKKKKKKKKKEKRKQGDGRTG